MPRVKTKDSDARQMGGGNLIKDEYEIKRVERMKEIQAEYGVVLYHEFQGGHAVSIFSKTREERDTLKTILDKALFVENDLYTLAVYGERGGTHTLRHDDDSGYHFEGCRIIDEMEKAEWFHVATFDEDTKFRIKVTSIFPALSRKKDNEIRVSWCADYENTERILLGFKTDVIDKLEYDEVHEWVLYPEQMLPNGAVKTSVKGVCKVATGEYVVSVVCKECGAKAGCRAILSFDGIEDAKVGLCDDCAIKTLTCETWCFNYGLDGDCPYINNERKPSECEYFDMMDYGVDGDEDDCSCPLEDGVDN